MSKIRIKISAILMILAMIASDGGAVILVYLLSAALHECGHLLAARALKIGIKEIRFDFSGIRICTEEGMTSYYSELILACAGPLVNLLSVTACIAYFSAIALGKHEVLECVYSFIQGESSISGAIGFFAASSMLQGGVNLLPINTLDGGRILFCSCALIFDERIARLAIKATSFAIAFILWTVALYLLLRVSNGLGIFVFSACVFVATAEENRKTAIPS